jgi:hypothetical protein
MFKTSVRKSVSLMVVAVILLSGILLAGCLPYQPEEGPYIKVDFSYLLGSCDFSEMPDGEESGPFPMVWYLEPDDFGFLEDMFGEGTVGDMIDFLLAGLTSPDSPCSNVPSDVALFAGEPGQGVLVPNDTPFEQVFSITQSFSYYFGPSQKNGEFVRLTLFGYVFDDGGSCVLWSLDGSPNTRPNEKCGGDVKLVCTVKLVEKKLKYDCKDGYDWLGFNITHDSQWLSWAHNFASQNGRP